MVLTARAVAVSFFQNPALDRDSNPNLIFQPSETVKRCGLDLRIYGTSKCYALVCAVLLGSLQTSSSSVSNPSLSQ
jgi:hypothetical protein